MRQVAQSFRDSATSTIHRLTRKTPVFKDPMAALSAPWLARQFDFGVVIMIRHPAAFCSSQKIKNWKFDFNNFLLQPNLLRDTSMGDLEPEIRYYAEKPQDIISQAALLWNCINIVISDYRTTHPEWLFVKHEQLSIDPLNGFRNIYAKLGLKFTESARAAVEASSNANNPIEQEPGKEFMRNSAMNVSNWRNRLTDREILIIKRRTHEVSKLFYTEAEW
jgi:hypothetical protein